MVVVPCLHDVIHVIQIVSIKPQSDLPGPWQLTIKNLSSGKTFTKVFDAVLVCTGHHAEKKVPHFQGLENFKGKVVHSHDYKDDQGYRGKRVVIVGIGNSGGDCAVELSRQASQVRVTYPNRHLNLDLHKHTPTCTHNTYMYLTHASTLILHPTFLTNFDYISIYQK